MEKQPCLDLLVLKKEMKMTKSVYAVFGASGFGREVMPLARDALEPDLVDSLYFVDDNALSDSINGCRVLSYEKFIQLDADKKFIVIAIADASVREKLTQCCIADGLNIWTIHARNVVKMDDVNIGEGAIICPFVTITSNVKIGVAFHANIYSYVAHDCEIGNYVTLAPSAKCNGNVVVEDYAYIGTGAIIKQGKPGRPIVIGKGAIVGMGAVVTKNVSAGIVVIGNPAKPLSKKALGG